MKRKSILMTIVAILFASVAIGQGAGSWPGSTDITNAAGVDTVYFCEHADSLYPIDLGYDGLNLSLLPSYGDWSLIATSNDNVAADYNLTGTANAGNGGAGNAFKTVGTKYGGYVFQYLAKEAQCGLAVGKKFFVFVFVLPDKNLIVDKGDTLICVNPQASSLYPINFSNTFKEYIDLYKKAGIIPEAATPDWAPASATGDANGVHSIDITEAGKIFALEDTLKINASTAHKEYTCGYEIRFTITAKVLDEIPQFPDMDLTRCAEDSITYANSDPNILFKRDNVSGTYYPATIGAAPSKKETVTINGKSIEIVKKGFKFTYKKCDKTTELFTYDTIYFVPGKKTDETATEWGSDTVIVCRTPGIKSIFTFYNNPAIDYPNIPIGKLVLDNTNSYWFDRGLTGKDGDLTGKYGTLDGTTSLVSYDVLVDNLASNMGYNYLWRPDGGAYPCLVDESGKIDTGIIVVIIQDEYTAQDFTAQLCEASYTKATNPEDRKLSLLDYTGLKIAWKSGPGLVPTKDSIDISKAGVGTHKYVYDAAADCGPGGTGVFYVKIAPRVKVSSSKTVKYCIQKLPASINLNDVLNIAVQGVTWQLDASGSTTGVNVSSADVFNTNKGILNILEFGKANPDLLKNPITLEFNIASVGANTCVTTGTKLILEFVTSI